MRRELADARRGLWHFRKSGIAGWAEYRRRGRGSPGGGTIARPARGGQLEFSVWPLPDAPARRDGLRVGVILDDFSRLALSYEWQQVLLPRRGWQAILDRGGIDLLFVESAWNGNSGDWQYQLTGSSGAKPEFRALLRACKMAGIPTVFWNKEDPVHWEDFIEAAELFDWVYTTDAALVGSYRARLGHGRIGVLPFAAQPAIHNPVRRGAGWQSRDVAFAGMYFTHRHAERREQLDMLLGAALEVSPRMETGLEIFSRQLGGDARYQFPAPLSSRVVGSLGYEQMLTAYRAYKVFLNVNTVTTSKTMCARRVFEISACGTPVVSTPSPAISEIFPSDEVLQVSGSEAAGHALRALVNSSELRDRMVHKAQRRIWAEHTYSHRVDTVLEAIGMSDQTVTRARRTVTALVSSKRPGQLQHVLETVAAQRGVSVQLAYLAHGWQFDEVDVRARAREAGIADTVLLQAEAGVPLGDCLNRLVLAADGETVAKVDDDDYYAPMYLQDQLNALLYSGADVVGKQAHYVYLSESRILATRFATREHRYTDLVMGPTIVAPRDLISTTRFSPLRKGEDTDLLRRIRLAGGSIYAADRFNFAQVRGAGPHTWQIDDLEILASSEVHSVGGAYRQYVAL